MTSPYRVGGTLLVDYPEPEVSYPPGYCYLEPLQFNRLTVGRFKKSGSAAEDNRQDMKLQLI
jgi:hypothetical protein